MRLSSFLRTVKWFQALPNYSHNSTSVICLSIVCSIWPIDKTLSAAPTLGQSGPGSNGNEEVLHIIRIFKAGTSPWFNIISRTLVVRGLPPAEMQSVYSTVPADWAIKFWGFCSLTYPYLPTSPLGQDMTQDQFLKRGLTGLNSEFSLT